MNNSSRTVLLLATLSAAVLASACVSTGGTWPESSAAAPAPAAAPATSRIGPGMNERSEVVDVKKVESGHGQKVKGLEDQKGEVTGKAFNSFFFGAEHYRHEQTYKSQGRLIFAGSSGFDSNVNLIWISHAASDIGYR